MGVVAADAAAFLKGFPGGPGQAGVFISEHNVIVDKIANRLHALPSRGSLPNNCQAAFDSRSVSQ